MYARTNFAPITGDPPLQNPNPKRVSKALHIKAAVVPLF